MRWFTRHWKLILSVAVLTCLFNLVSMMLFCSSTAKKDGEAVKSVDIVKRSRVNVYLVILVMTAPANQARRQVIRDTWGGKFKSKTVLGDNGQAVSVKFVLGTGGNKLSRQELLAIKEENDIYEDLLVLDDFEDSYWHLTEKIVLSINVISKQYNASYLMKCDDDTFIDSQSLLDRLRTLPASRLYWGYFSGAARVKTAGQWAEPNFHLCDRYLPYARGGGYIISWDLVIYLSASSELLQRYNSEDVSVGVWLAPLDIQRQHDVAFDTEATSRGCQNHHIVSHKQSEDEMRDKYKTLEETGKLCRVESKLRPEYDYNWQVPPSQCCRAS